MRRVLIVEDEVMVAMYIEDVLTDLGYEIIGLATNLDQALTLAQSATPDFAILDINLGGETSFPAADVLRAREIPFFFVSGYTSGGVGAAYRNVPRLRKPFRPVDLAHAIERLPAT